jgi:hypothetical protein
MCLNANNTTACTATTTITVEDSNTYNHASITAVSCNGSDGTITVTVTGV